MKKILALFTLCILWCCSFVSAGSNFGIALEEWVDTTTLWQGIDLAGQLDDKFTWVDVSWGESLRDFMARVGFEILIPVLVFASIVVAIIWFFKLMNATSDEEMWKASQYILWWIIWTMVMLSAWYLVDQIVWVDSWNDWIVALITWGTASWWLIAAEIYEKIFFPLLRMIIFIILWVMFVFAVLNAFKYITNTDWETKSKSLISLSYAASWILIIILAKSLVELVYGNYWSITDGATTLGEIWEWAINNADVSILHTVINWALWIVTFIIVLTIIYQWYLLLVMPSDEQTVGKLKKDFWYIFIWILIIWFAYLIVNFFIIQKI